MAAIGRLDQLHHDLCRLVLEKHHHNNMASRHIAVETWLEALGMTEYLPCFSQYAGVEDLLHLNESEVRDLGLKNAAHRAKIVSSLRILRDKYERNSIPGKKNVAQQQLQRNQNVTAQLSWSPPSLVNSPDYQVVNVSPEKLQHDLLVELQGDQSDLKSKGWYHGSVSRTRAERVVCKNGDFLVRDCISQPGDFVLTCCWKGGPLHFVINSTVVQQGAHQLPKVTYHFEDLHFNSVQDLIQYYMDECKPITDITGAVITTPLARTMPLSYYDSKYGALTANVTANHYAQVQQRPAQMPNRSPYVTPGTSPRNSPHVTPKVSPTGSPNSGRRPKIERAGSQPLLSVNDVPISDISLMDRADSLPMITGLMKQFAPAGAPPSHDINAQNMWPGDTGIYKQATPTMPMMPGDVGFYRQTMPMMPGDTGIYRQATPTMPGDTGLYRQATPTMHGDTGIYKQATPMVPGDTGIYKQVTPTSAAPAFSSSPACNAQAPQQFSHQRSGSAPVLTPGVTVTRHFSTLTAPSNLNPASSDSDLHKAPPPKPSRIPSVKYKKKPQVVIRNIKLYEDDYRDYSDYGQVTSEPSWLKSESANQRPENNSPPNQNQGDNMPVINHPSQSLSFNDRDVNQNLPKDRHKKISDTQFSILDGHDYSDIPAFPLDLNLHANQQNVQNNPQQPQLTRILLPKMETGANFDLKNFVSTLLPQGNKLLEPSSLLKARKILLDTDYKQLAKHLTSVDLEMLKVLNEEDLGVCVMSGLELLTLPQGRQLRQHVLERMYCLKAFIMLMVLTCQKVVDRAAMLSQWIQVANETKSTLGNLFGFENIMDGLLSDQIIRLRDTWMVLRQNHTSSAYVFDTKLKSSFRVLHDGSGSLPVQDICIPSITPIVQLLERDIDDQSLLPWEITDINNGLDIMLMHLDMGRVITAQCGVYRVMGNTVIKDLAPNDEMSEIFKTEFHLQLLWGSKGAGVNRTERQSKFNMLLTAYSEKIEREGDDGTAV